MSIEHTPAMLDRFGLMARFLAGKPPPPLPALPGRRCRGLHEDQRDELREHWDRDNQKLAPGWWQVLP